MSVVVPWTTLRLLHDCAEPATGRVTRDASDGRTQVVSTTNMICEKVSSEQQRRSASTPAPHRERHTARRDVL